MQGTGTGDGARPLHSLEQPLHLSQKQLTPQEIPQKALKLLCQKITFVPKMPGRWLTPWMGGHVSEICVADSLHLVDSGWMPLVKTGRSRHGLAAGLYRPRSSG